MSTYNPPATPIAKKKFGSTRGSDQDSISSVGDDSSSESGENCELGRRTLPKVTFLVQRVVEQIRSLYDLSALLRRPTVSNKYIRSAEEAGKLPLGEAASLQQAFAAADYDHVLEKVRQWRGLTKCDKGVATAGEGAVTEAMTVDKGEGCEDILWLCQRLSEANSRRREQLAYWIRHPYDPEADRTTEDPLRDVAAKAPSRGGPQGDGHNESQLLMSYAKPPDTVIRPAAAPSLSIMSRQTFSTVAVSDVYDTKTNTRARTVYAPTAAGGFRSASVPAPPKVAEDNPSFTCPYCGTVLKSDDMRDRQTWK